jgi:hypothetical protein
MKKDKFKDFFSVELNSFDFLETIDIFVYLFSESEWHTNVKGFVSRPNETRDVESFSTLSQ